jgi:hypothetical protein
MELVGFGLIMAADELSWMDKDRTLAGFAGTKLHFLHFLRYFSWFSQKITRIRVFYANILHIIFSSCPDSAIFGGVFCKKCKKSRFTKT